MLKMFRFNVRIRILRINRFCKRITVRSIIGNTSRYISRICTYLCTIDNGQEALGLANCLVPPPPTDEQKAEQLQEYMLRNVDESDRSKVLEHFGILAKERDQSDGAEEIAPNSIKTIRLGFKDSGEN